MSEIILAKENQDIDQLRSFSMPKQDELFVDDGPLSNEEDNELDEGMILKPQMSNTKNQV